MPEHAKPDYYTIHPPLQPKAKIARYVASCGIPVPEIYPDLATALASGKSFIARSEHPQDYAGASGLFSSLPIELPGKPDDIFYSLYSSPEPETYLRKLLLGSSRENNTLENYYRLTATDPNHFESLLSYSYWNYIPGINHSIVADSAVEDRYYIFSRNPDNPYSAHRSMVVNGVADVIAEYSSTGYRSGSYGVDIPALKLIRLYQDLRRLERFNPFHCPIIEAQSTLDGKVYFLQTHRTRDFQPAGFRIENDPTNGKGERVFVRGATPPQGLDLHLYAWTNPEPDSFIEQDTQAGWHSFPKGIFTELMSRKRQLFVLIDWGDPQDILNAVFHHVDLSALFKPPISIAARRGGNLDTVIRQRLKENPVPGNPFLAVLPIHVISDGRVGYVQVL